MTGRDETTKKPYHSPELHQHGRFAEVTRLGDDPDAPEDFVGYPQSDASPPPG
jgi:hypothetical protein